ncbi:DUF6434 domain-containing protein [Planktotalea sp.]|uniref:DUF6434 domain-containing protein n=1 Tax=Planktotalea sp. TaxID=2029877 RepID=UPI003298943E
MPIPEKPKIETICSGSELKQWYWLKTELASEAKRRGLKVSGAKFEILERLALFLDTGQIEQSSQRPKAKTSKFDWHAEVLSPETIITNSYKSTQNVRRFFTSELGANFKFNIEFMAWFKANEGKTLADACAEYRAMKQRQADPNFQSKIEPHNQFNQYTRDFLQDNPDLGMNDVRRVWALKIARPSKTGRHVYHPTDLNLT